MSIQGEQLDLTPKEFDLLVLLMRNPGRVFYSREVLLEKLWDMDFATKICAEKFTPTNFLQLIVGNGILS
ncbi:winged helix-turn-helix domain-containing protein [Paenibacillus tyrfis]|nr:helix-turn-helix domain-containing protein [Paenibacillus tyrfis]MCP1308559.1 winged helix-turn-helix domain-containing protein [Paenibacillus tyrfis]